MAVCIMAACILAAAVASATAAADDAPLPAGVKAVWDADKAWRETTPTRERICLNGLWRWQPAEPGAAEVPAARWGWFKVPGAWPGISDYMQKDCQAVIAHPAWRDMKLGGVAAAWHERTVAVPAAWAGRRIALAADYVNSYAAIYVDGTKAGELLFPGGEADLSAVLRPGETHTLSLLVIALPLKGVLVSYTDTAAAREVAGRVARRGLCGDVFLVSTPRGPRIGGIKVDTSVREGRITVGAALEGLPADGRYALRVRITDAGGKVAADFTSPAFAAADAKDGRFAFAHAWKPDRLWDIHTPGNVHYLALALTDAGGRALDEAAPVRFGFREFHIDGRDFYLNGTRIFLSALPLDNAQVGASAACYEGAKESMLRLKSAGINFVYTHNYDCNPGSHLGFEEILRAADDVGMLVSLTQPHFSHYDWKAADADASNGYARHAAFYAGVAGNHPSVACYAMSHNATGYSEDMNPYMIDGRQDARDTWAVNNSRLARRAEAVVARLDPARIVYHHASGNLGPLHCSNFYPNFVPIQEMSDWFEHWAAEGVKPLFLCEYGAPFTWDWTMYRGWYKGKREFGSAVVPWELCYSEWSAQFLGDRAFRLAEPEKANLRWEAKKYRDGALWHRWDYPHQVGSTIFDDRHEIIGMYIADNWRAHRTWGVSANSPWEFGHFWRPRGGLDRNARQDLPVDWEDLQRPGFSPDYVQDRYERMDLAYERGDWEATPDAQALLRNNQPLLAYIGGKPDAFTSKDHNATAGETVQKSLIVINNSRETISAECAWSLALPQPVAGKASVRVPTGGQERVPLQLALPQTLAPGAYTLRATVKFSTGETQEDAFTLHVLPPAPAVQPRGKVALFDPKGETARLLDALKWPATRIEADANLATYDMLIIGKGALTVDGPGPNLARVREGLRVIVFEQTADALEKRLGFRVIEYGLRQVFVRVPDHPALAGLAADNLRDWRGEAALLPPRLKYELRPAHGPTVKWCGIDVSRAWRAGSRGSVASVLIEKPACGDFLPIVDGGFSLQYAPLMEHRDGRGMILFCQLDVTGRTEADPAADRVARNLLQYVAAWQPSPRRTALYAGDPAGKAHLERAGVPAAPYDGGPLPQDAVLVVGPGGGKALAAHGAEISRWLDAGGRLLAVGLDQENARALGLADVAMKPQEYMGAMFDPQGMASPLAGVGPADVHSREPRDLPLVTGGAEAVGNGVLAHARGGRVVLCQLAPWQFDYAKQYNIKRTFRRTSCLVSRLLGGMGVGGMTPVLERFSRPADPAGADQRWLAGLYLDVPEEWDDPYRFFRW
jgi:hypothetical protein